jgi:hypothetical protein
MNVKVTIAVQQPDKVDKGMIAAELPRGNASISVVFGGLDVHDTENDTISVIATAAIEAFLDIDPDDWMLDEA